MGYLIICDNQLIASVWLNMLVKKELKIGQYVMKFLSHKTYWLTIYGPPCTSHHHRCGHSVLTAIYSVYTSSYSTRVCIALRFIFRFN